jgi:hypothetical protein
MSNLKSSEIIRLKVRLAAASSHAFSNGWVQNTGVTFLVVVIGLIVAMATSTQVKSAAITLAAVGTALLWIIAIIIIRHDSAQGPALRVETVGSATSLNSTPTELQSLIAGIEKYLLPDGFKVEPQRSTADDSGQQVADLEIRITGSLGSSNVLWVIECRDRPSEGPAPDLWIEQLIGRRDRFHFDKLFAVSTTGFSKAAIDLAKEKKIILRTVTRFTDIASDFKVQGIVYHIESMAFAGPLRADLEYPNSAGDMDIKDPLLKLPGNSEFLPLPLFVSRHPQNLFAINEKPGLFIFKFDGWLDFKSENRQFRVHNFVVPLHIEQIEKTSKALFATVYAEDAKPIWLEGEFEAETPKGKVKSRVQIFKNADGTESMKFFNDNMPEGYFPDRLELYGRD